MTKKTFAGNRKRDKARRKLKRIFTNLYRNLKQDRQLLRKGKLFLDLCEKEPVLGSRVLLVLARRLTETVRDVNKDKAILYEALCNEIEIGV